MEHDNTKNNITADKSPETYQCKKKVTNAPTLPERAVKRDTDKPGKMKWTEECKKD